MRIFTLVHKEFEKSGITKAVLAERLGKGAEQISHWLGTPGNWTLDTVSDLLFAIAGAEIDYGVSYPLERSLRDNQRENPRSDAEILAGINAALSEAEGAEAVPKKPKRIRRHPVKS